MTIVTFDTLQLVDKLKAAGFQQAQAETIIRVIAGAQDTLVTQSILTTNLKKSLLPSEPIRPGKNGWQVCCLWC